MRLTKAKKLTVAVSQEIMDTTRDKEDEPAAPAPVSDASKARFVCLDIRQAKFVKCCSIIYRILTESAGATTMG